MFNLFNKYHPHCFKYILLLTIWTGSILPAYPQSSATTVMIEQIVKLQSYIVVLEKGYQIVNTGLTIVGDIKKGDLSLHTNYFNSLETVSPQVKKYSKVAAIILMDVEIIQKQKSDYQLFEKTGMFSTGNLNYLQGIYKNLVDEVNIDIDQLTAVLSDNALQMKDDERLDRIDKLYARVQEKYLFLNSFNNSVQLNALQKSRELGNLQFIQKLLKP